MGMPGRFTSGFDPTAVHPDANGAISGPIILKTGTTANLATLTLLSGQLAAETDGWQRFMIGDGINLGSALPKTLMFVPSGLIPGNVLPAGTFYMDQGTSPTFYLSDGVNAVASTNVFGFVNADSPVAGQTLAYRRTTQAALHNGTFSPDLFLNGCHWINTTAQSANATINDPVTTSTLAPLILSTQRIVVINKTPAAASSGLTITWGSSFKFGNDSSGNNFLTKLNALLAAGGSVAYRMEFERVAPNWQCVNLTTLG